MRKLFLDIETSPAVAYVWRLYDENIGVEQVIEPIRVICVAWQFDDGKMEFASEWGDGRNSMISRIHQALDEADAVVHYNGASFDERHLNREFLQAGSVPPSNYRTIDLFRTVKAKFQFTAMRLAQVSKELELRDGKLKTDFELWKNVLAGDRKAQRYMERYNKEDVRLLVELYDEMLPWIGQHPNAALYEDGTEMKCTRCASTNLTKHGFYFTGASKFQRYRCGECGANNRGSKRLTTTPLREA